MLRYKGFRHICIPESESGVALPPSPSLLREADGGDRPASAPISLTSVCVCPRKTTEVQNILKAVWNIGSYAPGQWLIFCLLVDLG